MENVENLREKTQQIFARSPEVPLGPDGNPLKTSVCNEIEESVKKAAHIEVQLQNAKVI